MSSSETRYEPINKWTEDGYVVLYHKSAHNAFLSPRADPSGRENGEKGEVNGGSSRPSTHSEAQKDILLVSVGRGEGLCARDCRSEHR